METEQISSEDGTTIVLSPITEISKFMNESCVTGGDTPKRSHADRSSDGSCEYIQ